MTSSSIAAITLLADRPDLAVRWAELHWWEWGDEPGREELSWWVDDAAQAVRRTCVPVAFLALRHDGEDGEDGDPGVPVRTLLDGPFQGAN